MTMKDWHREVLDISLNELPTSNNDDESNLGIQSCEQLIQVLINYISPDKKIEYNLETHELKIEIIEGQSTRQISQSAKTTTLKDQGIAIENFLISSESNRDPQSRYLQMIQNDHVKHIAMSSDSSFHHFAKTYAALFVESLTSYIKSHAIGKEEIDLKELDLHFKIEDLFDKNTDGYSRYFEGWVNSKLAAPIAFDPFMSHVLHHKLDLDHDECSMHIKLENISSSINENISAHRPLLEMTINWLLSQLPDSSGWNFKVYRNRQNSGKTWYVQLIPPMNQFGIRIKKTSIELEKAIKSIYESHTKKEGSNRTIKNLNIIVTPQRNNRNRDRFTVYYAENGVNNAPLVNLISEGLKDQGITADISEPIIDRKYTRQDILSKYLVAYKQLREQSSDQEDCKYTNLHHYMGTREHPFANDQCFSTAYQYSKSGYPPLKLINLKNLRTRIIDIYRTIILKSGLLGLPHASASATDLLDIEKSVARTFYKLNCWMHFFKFCQSISSIEAGVSDHGFWHGQQRLKSTLITHFKENIAECEFAPYLASHLDGLTQSSPQSPKMSNKLMLAFKLNHSSIKNSLAVWCNSIFNKTYNLETDRCKAHVSLICHSAYTLKQILKGVSSKEIRLNFINAVYETSTKALNDIKDLLINNGMYKEAITANEHIFVYYVNALHKLAMTLKTESNTDARKHLTYNMEQKTSLAIVAWDICMQLQPVVLLDYIVSRNIDEYKPRLICHWASEISLRSHHEWCNNIYKERETSGRFFERILNNVRSSNAQVHSISIGNDTFAEIIQHESTSMVISS